MKIWRGKLMRNREIMTSSNMTSRRWKWLPYFCKNPKIRRDIFEMGFRSSICYQISSVTFLNEDTFTYSWTKKINQTDNVFSYVEYFCKINLLNVLEERFFCISFLKMSTSCPHLHRIKKFITKMSDRDILSKLCLIF